MNSILNVLRIYRLQHFCINTVVTNATSSSTAALNLSPASETKKRTRKPRVLKKSDEASGDVAPKSKKRTKGDEKWNEWRREIVARLHREYEEDRLRYASDQNTITARSRIVSFICDKRYLHLLSYATRYANTIGKNKFYAYDDELFALVLKFTAHQYRMNWASDSRWTESQEADALFHNLCHFITALNPRGNDAKAALVLAVDWASRWAALPLNDHRDDVRQGVIDLQRKLAQAINGWFLRHNPMIFSDEEFEQIRTVAARYSDGYSPKIRYDQGGYASADASKLIRDLDNPVDISEYLGSPFILPNASESNYMKLFREQLVYEEEASIKAKNFSRSSKLESMEKLIERWHWKDSIINSLEIKLADAGDQHIKSFLENVNTEECAEKLLDCIQAAMCKGQLLISLDEVEHNVCRVILGLVRRSFLKSISSHSEEILADVFADYLKYYTLEEVSRSHTIREWWSKCAALHNLKYDFFAPFSDLFSRPPTQLANALISIIMDSCFIPASPPPAPYKKFKTAKVKAFSYRNVMSDEESVLLIGSDKKTVMHKMIALHTKLHTAIEEHQFENLMFPCHLLPLKVPPRPWTDFGTGGPFYTRPQDILRNLFDFRHMSVNNELKKRLKNDSDARPVFDALNDLGATPWIINQPMLEQLMRAFNFADDPTKIDVLSVLSIPRHPSTVRVAKFEEIFGTDTRVVDVPIEKWRDFSKEQFESQKMRNELYSLWCSLLYRLLLAKHFQNDCLYFPHNMDFRGRVYPVSPHLNHMGDDINRGILKFARGKRLGKAGFRWLKLHCVNMTGLMKREPISRRLEFAEEKLEEMTDSAERPFDGRGWWLTSEEPWQTLAACMEIRDALNCPDGPEQFVSHLPIHQDGSCNGLQHYAALGRDYQGGYEVNLVPSSVPADVYSSVVARVEQRRVEHEQQTDPESAELRELTRELRAAMPQAIPRKVLKQTVMTTVYGVTNLGAIQQIRRQLKALGLSTEQCLRFAPYLTKQTFASLDEAFTNSMKLKKWFQNCAKSTVKLLQPIQWTTPLGLPVIQPYVEAEKKFDLLYLAPIPHKQTNAFPPNFVHSLDSTHMMLTTLHCRRRGITFAAVHDCFWTHACDVEAMNRICREQFIALHTEPIVQNFADFLQKTYLTEELSNVMPSEDLKEFQHAFTTNFKPGTLDIDAIRDSVYFFS